MATLAEIRAKLQQQENRGSGGSGVGDRAIYAHWNIPENSTAKLRFLPDGDPGNDFFWVERAMIRLPFAGVKGQADSKQVVVQVPCMEMWGETCPILTEVRPWFKDPSLEDMGRKYWKKRSYLFQGFVRETPMSEDETPDNPIRRFIISPQIFNVVKAALMDTEIEELPTDYERGLDFWVTKTTKGGYSDYSTSKWARKESALSSVEQDAINTHGLFNLKDFLPKKPGEVELKVLSEMFEASVDGQSYDVERWGSYFKPVGLNVDTTTSTSNVGTASPNPTPKVVADDEVPFEPDTPAVETKVESTAEVSTSAADILAKIRARQNS